MIAIENLVKSFVSDVKACTDVYSIIFSASLTSVVGYLAYKAHRKNKSQNKNTDYQK